jgi:hypothetical protein
MNYEKGRREELNRGWTLMDADGVSRWLILGVMPIQGITWTNGLRWERSFVLKPIWRLIRLGRLTLRAALRQSSRSARLASPGGPVKTH